MHGIVRYLMWAGKFSGSVERMGDRFVIDVDGDIRLDDEKRAIKQLVLIQEAGRITERNKPITKFFEKINMANVNESAFKNWVRSINNSINSTTIKVYEDTDHRNTRKEGRHGTGATTYLPIGPIYGKYEYINYSVRERVQYIICNDCFLMANLGLVYGSYVIRVKKSNRIYSMMMTLIPSGKADLVDIALVQRAFELQFDKFNNADIPTIVVPLLALSFGETLYGFEGLDAVIWVYEKSGTSQRIPSFTAFNVDKLLNVIATIKIEIPQWPRLLRENFLSEDRATILTDLVEAVLSGNLREQIYSITRSIFSYINQDKDKKRVRSVERILKKLVNALTS
jgi:CRISPR-associated protein Csa4